MVTGNEIRPMIFVKYIYRSITHFLSRIIAYYINNHAASHPCRKASQSNEKSYRPGILAVPWVFGLTSKSTFFSTVWSRRFLGTNQDGRKLKVSCSLTQDIAYRILSLRSPKLTLYYYAKALPSLI